MTKNSNAKLPMPAGRRLLAAWRDEDGWAVRNAALATAVVTSVLAYATANTVYSLFSVIAGAVTLLALATAGVVFTSAWLAAPSNGYRILRREKGRALEAAGSEEDRRRLAAQWNNGIPPVNLDGIPMNGDLDLLGRAYGVLDTGVAAAPGSDGSWLAAGHEYNGPAGMRD